MDSALTLVLAILFVDIAGEGLVFPITPTFLQHLGQGSPQAAANLYGASLALYAGLTLFFAPVWGMLSDRYGRKPILVFSMAGAAIGNLLSALAPNLEVYFLGRAIAGFTSANMVVINAYFVDRSPPEQRARNFGLIGAIFGIGFVVGPAIGGWVGDFGLRTPFWVVAALSAFTFLVALLFLPESLKNENRKKALRWLEANPFSALAALSRYPLVRALSWTVLFNSLAMQMLVAVWIPYFSYRFGFTPTQNGFALAIFGMVTAIGQAVVVPWLVPKLGERRSMLFGLSVSVLSFIAYGFSYAPWMLFATLVVGSLAAIDEPASQALISRHVADDEQGTVQGGLATINSLMGVMGPPLGTFLFSRFSGSQAIAELPGIPFFVGAMCVCMGLVLAYRALNRHGL